MYPTFCRFRADSAPEDRYFAEVAGRFALGGWRPGLALGAADALIEVLAAADGRTIRVPETDVTFGLDEAVALSLLDAVEEALEDAHEQGERASMQGQLQATLDLLERALGDQDMGAS